MPTDPPSSDRPWTVTDAFARTERLRAREGGTHLTAREVSTALSAAGIRHVVIGGHAMAAHGLVRNTEDVDVIAVGLGEAAAVIAALRAGARVERRRGALGCCVVSTADDRLADVLDCSGSHAQRAAIDTALTVDGIPVPHPVALMAMKFAALTSATRPHGKRHQDLADLIHLVDRYHRGRPADDEVAQVAAVVAADACGDPDRGAARWQAMHAAILAGTPIAV